MTDDAAYMLIALAIAAGLLALAISLPASERAAVVEAP